MPTLPFFTADVFTTTRFGGNPLAVVMGGETLDSTFPPPTTLSLRC